MFRFELAARDADQGKGGLLNAAGSARIAAAPGGFMQVMRRPWFEEVDWEAMLKREEPAPWLPAALEGEELRHADFSGREVMEPSGAYGGAERDKWEKVFAEFGPHRAARWPDRPGEHNPADDAALYLHRLELNEACKSEAAPPVLT